MDSYGRSTGYAYARGGSVQQSVSYGYGTDGRLNTAGFTHGGEAKQFSYKAGDGVSPISRTAGAPGGRGRERRDRGSYLPGTHLLQTLTMPSGMTLTQQYEQQLNLLTAMLCKRGETSVVERFYTYDTLGRPLAIQKDATWYTYGWDLTKNICELFSTEGTILTTYRYTPYGAVTAEGNTVQPIQWSSEFSDDELGLVYYNFRHYDSATGRWIRMDTAGYKAGNNLYRTANNSPAAEFDYIGLESFKCTKKTVGKAKNLRVKITLTTNMKEEGHILVDTQIGGELVDAISDSAEFTHEVVENEFEEIKKGSKKLKSFIDDIKGIGENLKDKYEIAILEVIPTSGGYLDEIKIDVSADVCCCLSSRKRNYGFKKAKGDDSVGLNFHIKYIDKYVRSRLKYFPEHFANASYNAMAKLKKNSCKKINIL